MDKKVPKYNPEVTRRLEALREPTRLSLAQVANHFGRKKPDTIRDWETGMSKCPETDRRLFITYLLSELGLGKTEHGIREFLQLWDDLMIMEWEWNPLDLVELERYLPKGITSKIYGALISQVPLQRPPRADHFVGREAELQQLLSDLQPGRVLTLCGPGGIGKSALAAEAVWRLAPGDTPPDIFPDGIIFHNFYNQPQADLALEHIARSFGEEPRPTPAVAAQRALARRRVLVLLDGAENADNLRAVLEIRGESGVLVTSRSRKDAGSYRQDIAPLPLRDAAVLLQKWGGARAANETAAIEICDLVGALPLAVRLVGRYLAEQEEEASDFLAWLRQTPLQALDHGKRQLENVPLLLERNLAKTNEVSRQALAMIGLLALAPFDREVVAESLGIPALGASSRLGELVNYGLLLREEQRYTVSHALVHTYARRRMTTPIDVAGRLAAYYIRLSQEQGPKGPAGYARLDLERPHITATILACNERRDWESAVRLAQAIDEYLYLQGHWTERIITIEAGLAASRKLGRRQDEEAFFSNLGTEYIELGRFEQAIVTYQQALEIARELQDVQSESHCLSGLGNAYRNLGRYEQAITYHQQALQISREIGDRRGEGVHLGDLGNAYRNLGRFQEAIDHYQQALIIHRQVGDRRKEGTRLGNLGLVFYSMGQFHKAIEYHQQALAIHSEIGDNRNTHLHLGNLGSVNFDLGRYRQAFDYYHKALVISREVGDRRYEGFWLGSLGNVHYYLKEYEKAIEHYGQALQIARQTSDKRYEGNWLSELGKVYLELGYTDQAIDYTQQALAIAREIKHKQGESARLGRLGEIYYSIKEYERSIEFSDQALIIAREISNRRLEGNYLNMLGHAWRQLGHVEHAIDHYRQALTIVQEIGQREQEANTLLNLGNLYSDSGQIAEALKCLKRAMSIFEEIESPISERIRDLIRELEGNF